MVLGLMGRDFYGLEEGEVSIALDGILVLSGDGAFDHLYKLIDRIGRKRWSEFEFLLSVVRFFGARVAMIHIDDLDPESADEWGTTEHHFVDSDSDVITGMFRPADCFIELPLHRFTSWLKLEEVLRHEVIHLLQHYTDPDNSCPCYREQTHLLSDSVAYGSGFAAHCREVADDEIPAFEIEAYTAMSWTKIFRDWSNEVMKSESWSGKCCPIA